MKLCTNSLCTLNMVCSSVGGVEKESSPHRVREFLQGCGRHDVMEGRALQAEHDMNGMERLAVCQSPSRRNDYARVLARKYPLTFAEGQVRVIIGGPLLAIAWTKQLRGNRLDEGKKWTSRAKVAADGCAVHGGAAAIGSCA